MQTITAIPRAPARPDDAHKGTFGTVIIVGGCPTMPGAPALAASAALRSGVGLVKIASQPEVVAIAIGIEPSATGIVLPAQPHRAASALDLADPQQRAVLAVGPGMGPSAAGQPLVESLLHARRAMVLDADGLNLLAASGNARSTPRPPLVMTPHPGEFRRLAQPLGIDRDPTDPAQRQAAAAELARAQDAVVVLKGRDTIVSDARRVYTNHTGNPALSTAGTGDILTGLIAALIAQGMGPFDAAVLGVYLHGLAADMWRKQHGPSGMTASDLAALLPDAFANHRRSSADTAPSDSRT